MNLSQTFISQFSNANNPYELMALCMQEISKKHIDNSIAFIGDTVYYAENIPAFNDFRMNLQKKIHDCLESHRDDLNQIKTIIFEKLLDFEDVDGYDSDDIHSICMFFVMQVIDDYLRFNADYLSDHNTIPDNPTISGPLNGNINQCQYAVYLKETGSFLERANAGKEDRFRSKLFTPHIGDRFLSVQIIDKKRFPTSVIPIIKQVYIHKKYVEYANSINMLKIAAIPYICFDTFRFHEKGKDDPCDEAATPHGPFYVDYSKTDEDNIQRIIALLDKAIEACANIIVFPEFIMSPAMLEAIKKHLSSKKKHPTPSLWFVVAGTTFEYGNDGKISNNIMHILSNKGKEFASYYKYYPYSQEDKPDEALKKGYAGISTLEYLSDPGKEICLLDVIRIGRVLPAVCRDVIEPDYTRLLSYIFQPSMQIIPAWSTSVNSFDKRLIGPSDAEHIPAIVCNCCNAVDYALKDSKKTNVPIGKAYIPEMQGPDMHTVPKEYKRAAECYKKCKEGKKGCICMVNIDVSDIQPNCFITKIYPD